MTESVVIIVVLAMSCVCVSAYPNGAPVEACVSMFPTGHLNYSSQDATPPYEITVSTTTYTAGSMINVTMSGIGPKIYEGVFLQARRADCSNHDTPVGTFDIYDAESDRLLKLLECTHADAGVTHKDHEKKDSLTVMWMAPDADVGPIYFRGTFVREVEEFWTNVFSPVINKKAGDKDVYCDVQKDAQPSKSAAIGGGLIVVVVMIGRFLF